MSMDDQYREMVSFTKALVAFNERMKASMRDLEARHDAVSPHWQDEMRKTYDQHWEPLDEMMKNYLRNEGPRYVEFLHIKMHVLERYLRGG